MIVVCSQFGQILGVIINNKAENVVVTVGFLMRLYIYRWKYDWPSAFFHQRNVGKSLTLDLLAKGQGVAIHKH